MTQSNPLRDITGIRSWFGLINQSNFALSHSDIMIPFRNLKKSKHFTLGRPNLYVAVDLQPLLKVLGDRNLENIHNPRLLNLKEKSLRQKNKEQIS